MDHGPLRPQGQARHACGHVAQELDDVGAGGEGVGDVIAVQVGHDQRDPRAGGLGGHQLHQGRGAYRRGDGHDQLQAQGREHGAQGAGAPGAVLRQQRFQRTVAEQDQALDGLAQRDGGEADEHARGDGGEQLDQGPARVAVEVARRAGVAPHRPQAHAVEVHAVGQGLHAGPDGDGAGIEPFMAPARVQGRPGAHHAGGRGVWGGPRHQGLT